MNTEIKNLRQELDYLLENVEIFYKNKHKNKVKKINLEIR